MKTKTFFYVVLLLSSTNIQIFGQTAKQATTEPSLNLPQTIDYLENKITELCSAGFISLEVKFSKSGIAKEKILNVSNQKLDIQYDIRNSANYKIIEDEGVFNLTFDNDMILYHLDGKRVEMKGGVYAFPSLQEAERIKKALLHYKKLIETKKDPFDN